MADASAPDVMEATTHSGPRALAGAARVVVLLCRSNRMSRAFSSWAAFRRAENLTDQIERLRDLLLGDAARPRPARPEEALAALARVLARVATSPSANLQAAARTRGRLVGRRVTREKENVDAPEICPDTPGEMGEKELARAAARVRGIGAPMARLFEKYADDGGRLTRARAVQHFRDVDVVPALASDADVATALAGDDYDDFCCAVAKLAFGDGGGGDGAGAGGGDDPLRGIFRVMAASRRFYEASELRRSPPKTPAQGLLRRWR